MAGLGTVPPDVLELIAYHAAVENTARPPSGLLALLLVNRRIHSVLQPSALPHLYASIFRATFDLPALHRRLPKSRLTSPRLALELQRRWTALKAVRAHPLQGGGSGGAAASSSSASGMEHEHMLWTVFLMCLENDGRNLHLLRSFGQSTRWVSSLAGRLFARHHPAAQTAFLPARMSIEPRAIPRDTVEVALVVWLFWFLKSKGDVRAETQLEKERNRTMLRVFVFAAQIFDAPLQPWTLPSLPLPPPSTNPSSNSPRLPGADHPFLADLTPRSSTVSVPYFGESLELGKPNACWAGMMAFFQRTKVWRDVEVGEDEVEDESDPGLEGDDGSRIGALGGAAGGLPPAVAAATAAGPTASSSAADISPSSRSSTAFDLDWARLLACREPYALPSSAPSSAAPEPPLADGSAGLGVWKVRGTLEGVWGGEFAFLDFDSYRDMLSGRDRVIYEGAFGIQPQIFRLSELLVLRPASSPAPSASTEATPALNAFFPHEFVFPFANARPTGAEATGQAGYATVSPAEEARLRACGTADDVSRLELVLAGSGHSAWGRFNLSGRVRLWDGLVYLLKDYSPESRGRWLYRGYVTGGGTMVGRWRDTFSPEMYSGYEGSFHMTRRG